MEPVVLIVDDNEDNRFTLSMRLEACGYENIVTAEDGSNSKRCAPRVRSTSCCSTS